MPGLRMKSSLLLPLVLAVLALDQSASALLPERQSAGSLLSRRTNPLPPSDVVITSADNLVSGDREESSVTRQGGGHFVEQTEAETPRQASTGQDRFVPAGGDDDTSHMTSSQPLAAVTGDPAEASGGHTDLGQVSDGPSWRQLHSEQDHYYGDFQRRHDRDEKTTDRAADHAAQHYHNGPSAIYEDSYHPAEDCPSADRYTRHHETPTIQQRDAKSDITSFGLPRDTERFEDDFTRPRERKYVNQDDGGVIYNRRTSVDGSDTYKQPAAASESRDGDGENGFMGGNIHQSLMAKIRGASAHAFDGAGNHGRLDFGPSSGTKGAEGADTAPSYKPVYEAPSRQPDPRPHAGERPSRAQDTGERDYEANGPGNDHRGNGGYQDDTANHGQEPSQSQDYRGQDDNQGEDYRGKDYQGEDYRGEDYRGEDYGGEDYRDEGYGGEEGRRGGYASFDPYKEAVQEEEAYRAVEGEADRYGQYSRSQGGTRHSDDEQSTAYPSRYQEAAMYRGYDGHRGYQENRDYGSHRDRSRRNGRGGYHSNREARSVVANRAHDFGRQKRDLGNSKGLNTFGSLFATSDDLHVVPGDLPATSGDLAVTYGDLLPAGSESRTAYQRQYTGYGGQRSRQSSASEPDPYERYLPREDNNDPYFRYAPRDSIQHSHDHEQSVRTGEGSHNQYDLYGRPQRNSRRRRPRQDDDDDHIDYDDEDYHSDTQEGGYPSYGDYNEDYSNQLSRNPPRKLHSDYEYDDLPDNGYHSNDPSDYDDASNGRRGNRRGSGQRYQEDEPSEDYEDDQAEDYDDDHGERYEDRNRLSGHKRRRHTNRPGPAYQSRSYEDKVQEGQYSDEDYEDRRRKQDHGRSHLIGRDRKYRQLTEKIPDVASRGFEDTREAVSGMLVDMTRRRKDSNCMEVKRDGMTCLQCSDAKGMQTEECAYAGGEPSGRHTGYSSSSSYGSQPQQPEGGRDTSYSSSSSYGSQPRQPEGGRDTSYGSSSSYGSQPQQPVEGRGTSYSSSSSYGSQPQQPVEGRDTSYSSSSSYGSQPRQPVEGRDTSYSSSSSYGSQPRQPEGGRDTSYGSSSSNGSQPRQPEGGRDTSYDSSSSNGSQPRQPVEGRDTSYSSSSSYGSQPRQPEGDEDTSYGSSSSYGSQPRQPVEGRDTSYGSSSSNGYQQL